MLPFDLNITFNSNEQMMQYAVVGDGIIRAYLGTKVLNGLISVNDRHKLECNKYMSNFIAKFKHEMYCKGVKGCEIIGLKRKADYFEALIGWNFIHNGSIDTVTIFLDDNEYINN